MREAPCLLFRIECAATPMRLRTSRCLVFLFKQDRLIGFNFQTKQAFSCSPAILTLLQGLADWTDEREICGLLPNATPAQAAKVVKEMITLTAIIEAGSPGAGRDDEFQNSWEWGLGTSLLHFSLQDVGSYVPLAEGQQWRKERALHDPSPPLYRRHDGRKGVIALEPNDKDPLLALFKKRRTNRTSLPAAVPVTALADCLRAGLGITGFADSETGKLPLAMTPSGGARNPFEAYLYARQIDGLERGFYHYSAVDHSLLRLSCESQPQPSRLLADQDWADAMPCIIFLVAHFERTMWKYRDDNGYRVVLIEAGHIAQNIMLMATQRQMTACPTALLRHSEIHACLGIARITQSVLYALTLSYPDTTANTSIS
jgi:SagB-type dehydrogenase family enzyme